MANKVLVFNTTPGPLPLDDDGHMLGGWETAEVQKTAKVERGLRLGLFIEPPKPTKEAPTGTGKKE